MRFTLFFLCFVTLCQAQDGFNYQSIVRDIQGNILANQGVQFRIGIIENDIANAVSYSETHSLTTNAYGGVQFNIGEGTIVSGDFSAIDWSVRTFVQIELDITGGNSFVLMGTSELLAVPKAKYAEKAGNTDCGGPGICVKDYGAKGDNTTDDTQAFIDAFNAASASGRKVMVPIGNYRITSSLSVPDGVTLIGEGVGTTPVGTPFNGSAIRFEGSGAALIFSGHTSGMRDMLVYDVNQGSMNADGIHLLADGELIESLRFFNVLIFYFTGGTALKLESINAGGIAYCSFYNVRVRNAKTGIHITQDGNSFTNSNTWHHGAISGGGFDYCLRVSGGNNNLFYGTIMEPFQSTFGHLVVEAGEIQCHEIRIEGNSQVATTPLVKFNSGTKNSHLSGTYAGGLTIDEGNNYIAFRSGKATRYFDGRSNIYENANFFGFENGALPFWDITGAGVTAEIQDAELSPQHKVLKLTVPAGITANLEQTVSSIPTLGDLERYQQVNFGMYVKCNQPDIIYTRMNAPTGVTVSQTYNGDNQWHFVGMNAAVNTTTTLDARLEIANTTGSNVIVYISMPTMNFGNQVPDIAPKPINSNGGIMTGPLSHGVVSFTPATTFIVLPKEGNLFQISGTQNIIRINHSGTDRFPRGTIIRLLFNDSGLAVSHNVYIQLKNNSNYTSVENGSLSLMSNGDGTWREVDRNE